MVRRAKHVKAPDELDRKAIRALAESAMEAAEAGNWMTYLRRCVQAEGNHGHPGMVLFLALLARYISERVGDHMQCVNSRVAQFEGDRPTGITAEADEAMLANTYRFIYLMRERREPEARQLYSELAAEDASSALLPSGMGAVLVVLGPPGDTEPEYWRRMGKGT
jgi:phosphate uptake regulator